MYLPIKDARFNIFWVNPSVYPVNMNNSKPEVETTAIKEEQTNVGAGSVEENQECTSSISEHEADKSQVELKPKVDTPQKPHLKSVEKVRLETTPELPVFKSQTHRVLDFDGRTPARSTPVGLDTGKHNQ